MHPGKVHAGEIDKGVVAGKDDFFGPDGSMLGLHQMTFYRLDKGVFIDCQFFAKTFDQFKRVELGLVLESNRTCGGYWQRWILQK